MKPQKVRKIQYLIFITGVIIAFLGILLSETTALMIIGIVVMFAAVIFHFIFYRCPHCGAFLDRSTGEFCPQCGRKVNE